MICKSILLLCYRCGVSTQPPDYASNKNIKEITQKLLKCTKSKLKPEPRPTKCRKIRLCNYEDEDIVNREESYITDDQKQSQAFSPRSGQVDQHLEANYCTESPEVPSKKQATDYFTCNSQRYCTLNLQPCGDQESEIVFDLEENSEIEFVIPSKGMSPY